MYSIESEMFSISNSFDRKGRFTDISFEIIREPSMVIRSSSMSILKQELLELYRAQGWTMPPEEIYETLEEAMIIIIMKHRETLCGFFAVRHYLVPGHNDCWYLERLILSNPVRFYAIVPLTALLVFNLPGFGKNELTLCAISRLKVVSSLIKLFGPHFFCSSEHLFNKPGLIDKARACLAVISEKEPLHIDPDGLLRNTFNPDFTHDHDSRIISSVPPLSEYDAVFLMNTIPSTKEKVFEVLRKSSLFGNSRFICSILESLQNNILFKNTQRRSA